ncbi:MAG: SPOR domain-containing protein [Polaromonas sp.]|nr:SPOR domain-containing protein [Polaromonas sp.]
MISFNKQQHKHQRGNTLLGLIIGVLVGLGAALAVAVYVTKVPVPFLNKTSPRSADTDAAEAKKNKDWDPNVPLAGKAPAKPAPAASGLVGTVTAAPATAAASAAVVGKPKVSADPLGDLAKAKSEGKADAKPETAAATTGADPFSYFIQAGAFRTPEDAEQQRAKLSLLGFQAKVTEREQSGRTVYRVRLGPFDKKDEADKTKEKLDSQSIEAALVRVQR